MPAKINTRIQHKHDIESNWLISNLIPLKGELIIYDTDSNYSTPRFKIGDGENKVSELPFASQSSIYEHTHQIAEIEGLQRKLDEITPPPDIESTEDVILSINQLRLNLNDIANTLVSMNETINTQNSTIQTLTSAISALIPAVGEIYITTSSENPSLKFGGTWEQIKDTFLLASGDTYSAGSIGGEATHTLTVDELPSHSHDFLRHQLWGTEDDPVDTTVDDGYGASNKTLNVHRDTTTSVGSGQAHNNMPPYLAVYVWKRIA